MSKSRERLVGDDSSTSPLLLVEESLPAKCWRVSDTLVFAWKPYLWLLSSPEGEFAPLDSYGGNPR